MPKELKLLNVPVVVIFQNYIHQCRHVGNQSLRHLLASDSRRFFDEIEFFLLTLSEFRLRHVSDMISDVGSVGGSEDGLFIINAEEKGDTQAIGKSANALKPTLRLLLFKHYLEVVCCTFSYQIL